MIPSQQVGSLRLPTVPPTSTDNCDVSPAGFFSLSSHSPRFKPQDLASSGWHCNRCWGPFFRVILSQPRPLSPLPSLTQSSDKRLPYHEEVTALCVSRHETKAGIPSIQLKDACPPGYLMSRDPVLFKKPDGWSRNECMNQCMHE